MKFSFSGEVCQPGVGSSSTSLFVGIESSVNLPIVSLEGSKVPNWSPCQ